MAGAAVGLVACLSGTASAATDPPPSVPVEAATARPFAEVQASPFSFESDPSDPSRAIFRVTTTAPMICAIVWGDDDTFGRFNNSLSMNGTGITQHDVVLPDVEAGVTYQYVVEGTTADGTWYRSDVGTFSVQAAATATTVDRGPNLATGAQIVDVSSEFSDDFAAANAIDGDTATEWATDGDGDSGSITIDLGAAEHVGGVAFLTRSMADGTAITDTFTLSVDGSEPLGPFPAGTVASPRVADVDVTGEQLRFDVATSSGGNVGAVEIEVYG
jgi:hypothetical protein